MAVRYRASFTSGTVPVPGYRQAERRAEDRVISLPRSTASDRRRPLFVDRGPSHPHRGQGASCRGWGWTLIEHDPALGVARFSRDDGPEAMLESGEGGGLNGKAYLWLPLCYWPDEEDEPAAGAPTGRGDDVGCGDGRQEFDAWFAAAQDEVERRIGGPARSGKYEYRHRVGWPYSYAVWRGQSGCFILQQDEIDIQFGFDISIWIVAAEKGGALPAFPLTGESGPRSSPTSTDVRDSLGDRDLDG